ncbi:MAG TPA: arylsulfotransferase family protein [Gemmatimonadaceae bacterium]|nr:arylsulfotransferase family protein [Gemmatimonadaceae bacterium]
MRSRGILGAAMLVAACDNDLAAPSFSRMIDSTLAAANPHNALSAIVTVRVRQVDSVAVRFRLADAPATGDSITPAAQTAGDSAAVPVLGLLPERRYILRAVAYWAGGNVVGEPVEFTTGNLPLDIPRYSVSGSDPSPGFVVFAAGTYGLVIDNTGRVVWYRQFPNGPGLNFMAEPNGRYAARPTTPDPTDVEPWLELDALGNITRTFSCALGLQSRFHDLISEPDGGYWLMCDETRTMDLAASGGVASARVTGTAVQHLSAAGALLFHWSPFDHFAITDVDPADRTGANVNWTHGNALDFDVDGNLIVSFRSLEEITKINVATGAVMWRMGGRRNQFTFLDSPMPPFSRQHGARISAPGALMLLDNVGNPFESRVERYTVDEAARTARLAHSYASDPGVVTLIGGSVQSLAGGRTLVSFGTAGRVEEYDAAGRVMWRIAGDAGYVFRAQRIRSLYKPGLGSTR